MAPGSKVTRFSIAPSPKSGCASTPSTIVKEGASGKWIVWSLMGHIVRDMIVEQRDYHVFTGKLPELVRLYETEGIAIQNEVLGGLIGAFTTDIGALSTYTHMWRYADFADRQARRATLQARDDWKAFLAKIQPLIHTQHSRILLPTSFSPIR